MAVVRLPNGKWQASVSLNEKRVRRNFDSKKKADDFVEVIRLEKLGIVLQDKKYTIEQAFANYLETETPHKSKGSQQADHRFFKIALCFFKSASLSFLDELTVEALSRFEIWLANPQQCGSIVKPAWLQPSIARNAKSLKSLLKRAFLTGKIGRNPAELWRIRGIESEKRKPMARHQLNKILEISPPWFTPILKTLAMTGQRPISVANLKWEDVDFENAILKFRTKKGMNSQLRTVLIPMFPELHELLSSIWNAYPCRADDFVFMKEGLPVSAGLISKTASRLIKRAGLKGVVLYGLRHALATDLLKAGVSTEIARRLMGHSDERMLKQYTSQIGMEPLEKALISIRGKKAAG